LEDLVRVLREREVRSVAVPPLGCGNGGLDWDDVRQRIRSALRGLEDVHILVFEPRGAPDALRMPVGSKPPRMTPGRAALIGLLARFTSQGAEATPLAIQKLMYFLQVATGGLADRIGRKPVLVAGLAVFVLGVKRAIEIVQGQVNELIDRVEEGEAGPVGSRLQKLWSALH
jgi:hypothetical protein